MVLSEAEAEARLVLLRRQRETLDRTITDLTLYLELGRRLRTGSAATETDPIRTASPTMPRRSAHPTDTIVAEDHEAFQDGSSVDREHSVDQTPPTHPGPAPSGVQPRPQANAAPASPREPEPGMAGTSGPDPNPIDGALSEGVLARRYGRALIEAAVAVLEEAGRPLHAGEILAALSGRGFSLPGHDPVAALNTRLWKRSGAGGPFKRLGDAVYALADEEG